MPRSSAIILPPVSVAMSSSIALRRSPKPGARTAQALSEPRSLLTTSVASASPSSSSAMISSGLPAFATCSSSGKRSCIPEIFFSWMRTYASSNTVSMRSGSVTKYGERYPRSNCIPSTVSSVVSRPFASSTVITPSLPTLSMASAILSPISLSPLAEMVPTCAISFRPLVGAEIRFNSSTTNSTALSMPRFSDIGFAPAVTDFRPSRKIACASTVAVVVPSPAISEVLVATSFTIWAPMFSISSSSSISFATVTPSLVIVGLPNFLSMTTLRGADSFAGALAIPFVLYNGEPFPGRNLILLLTFCVIFATLVLQGLTLTPLVRWLGVVDDHVTEKEERLARLKANEAALARLEAIESSHRARHETVERLRTEYNDRIRQLRREVPHEESVKRLFSEDFEELAREALQTERDTVLGLRNEEAINDQALRRIQRDIDLAEARLQRPT